MGLAASGGFSFEDSSTWDLLTGPLVDCFDSASFFLCISGVALDFVPGVVLAFKGGVCCEEI